LTPPALTKNALTLIAVAVGAATWSLLTFLRPDVSPMASGLRCLIALGIAGFLVALLERELSWDGLLGLYFGQALVLCSQAFLGFVPQESEPLPLRMLFLLPFNLATACGGVAGAFAAGLLWPPRPASAAKLDPAEGGR
jgi:hypothetical protein